MARRNRKPRCGSSVAAVSGLVFLIVIFQIGMLVGFLLLFAFWAAGGHRSLPLPVIFIFVFGLPIAGWLIGTLTQGGIILLIPLSFSVAFAWSYRERRAAHLLDRAGRSEKLINAERQISQDRKNAGAYLARAEILEEDGRYEEAQADYERAFGASERVTSRYALQDHKDRLSHAIKAREARLEYEKYFFIGFIRAARFEWAILAAGALVATGSPVHGISLISMGLMAAWCRRLTRF